MTQQTGIKGEQLAANFLLEQGYELVQLNWRHKHLEVDIIAKNNDVLVFVEVKTRSTNAFGEPEQWVDSKKQKRLIRAANAFVNKHQRIEEVRFDIIAIIIDPNLTAPQITHFEDAFSATS